MNNTIKVLIVDDQKMVREGLELLLSLDKTINVVGQLGDGKEVLAFLKENNHHQHIDVILMDIRMPNVDGVQATKIIKTTYPNIKILVLTTFDDEKNMLEAMNVGASGFMLKDVGSEELLYGIKKVYNGSNYLSGEMSIKLLQQRDKDADTRHDLTKREIEIGQLVSLGKSNKDIAKELYITEGTVKNHVSNILSKLELKQRTQLVIYFRNN